MIVGKLTCQQTSSVTGRGDLNEVQIQATVRGICTSCGTVKPSILKVDFPAYVCLASLHTLSSAARFVGWPC